MDVYGILCIIAHKKIKEHDGGFIQMKKIISLLAALTLMCSTMVLPPVNADAVIGVTSIVPARSNDIIFLIDFFI